MKKCVQISGFNVCAIRTLIVARCVRTHMHKKACRNHDIVAGFRVKSLLGEFMWLILIDGQQQRSNSAANQPRIRPDGEVMQSEMQLTTTVMIVSALLTGCLDAGAAAMISTLSNDCCRSHTHDRVSEVIST